MLRREITTGPKAGKSLKDIRKRKRSKRVSPMQREICSKGLMTALVSTLVRDADLRRETRYGYYPGGSYVLGSSATRERVDRLEDTMAVWLKDTQGHWRERRGKSGGAADPSSQPCTSRSKPVPLKCSPLRPRTAAQPIKALLTGHQIRPQEVLPSPKTIGRKPESVRSVINVKIPSPKRGETPERGQRKGHWKSISMVETAASEFPV